MPMAEQALSSSGHYTPTAMLVACMHACMVMGVVRSEGQRQAACCGPAAAQHEKRTMGCSPVGVSMRAGAGAQIMKGNKEKREGGNRQSHAAAGGNT